MSVDIGFEGELTITPPLRAEHLTYLTQFADSRRMPLDVLQASSVPDPARLAVGLPVGDEGEYCVAHGQGARSAHVLHHNRPPHTQPSLNCGWSPTPDGQFLEITLEDGFVEFEPWLTYLIARFLGPWGYRLDGEVTFELWEAGVSGRISVVNNSVTVAEEESDFED